MKSNYLLYYIIHLVKEGHRWQYQNLNGSGTPPLLWFSFLQLVAILIAVVFLLVQPDGLLHTNVIDYVLSSLSILTGIYLSLIVFIYDRYKALKFDEMNDTKHIRTWNFYSQLNSLTSYSILIAILVIMILMGALLFGEKTNIFNYEFTSHITCVSIALFLKLTLIVLIRVSFVYFLFDFFILCLYIVSGIFQFVSSDMSDAEPKKVICHSQSAFKRLWRKHRIAFILSWLCIIIFGCLIAVYLFLSLFDAFKMRIASGSL